MTDQKTPSATTCLTPFGAWVSYTVRTLAHGDSADTSIVGGYLGDSPTAVAAIAKLSHNVGHAIGSDPDIFYWTVPDVDDTAIYPHGAPVSSEPTREELAAHAAITLYAMHQQSNHEMPMHTDAPISIGRAVGAMAFGNINEKGIRSAFDKLQTASSWAMTVMHARHLIQLLKREDIAINYGLFAQDMVELRSSSERGNRVRLRWGRDYQSAYAQAKAKAED
ncbi:type I-E CRISPR-associated protein Cse2/CasB [Bifidobacterium cuniculi]|uniref:Cse2 family CRISPR-associated protein n=1 Tax=Bifidobacterium cuniculi TaxID=1688 RepID=A0A087AT75_9BIFI|nr:type I-E CRISPR-associated protein Cse2/CasB [Bifidobacterium cuniculi]KFI61975.1 Cse2 family CRISPR-associated protein [Bifidobacterium cuniculi]